MNIQSNFDSSDTSSRLRQPRKYFFQPSISLNSSPKPDLGTGFLPVTPTWLQSVQSTTMAPRVVTAAEPVYHPRFQRQSYITSTKSSSTTPSFEKTTALAAGIPTPNLNQFWTAQLSTQPILTQLQRPVLHHFKRHHHRRPRTQFVTVKHGIYPILKTRRRIPALRSYW